MIRGARISMIACMARNRVIGKDGKLPWKLPHDMKRFRSLTLGKPIIMGRKTYDSIGMPLPQRQNIVMSRMDCFLKDPIIPVQSMAEAVGAACDLNPTEVMIIGGAQVYEAAMPLADRIYMTIVHDDVPGDVLFPVIDERDWTMEETGTFARDDRHAHTFSFYQYDRRR